MSWNLRLMSFSPFLPSEPFFTNRENDSIHGNTNEKYSNLIW
jgi:hypothetical protein